MPHILGGENPLPGDPQSKISPCWIALTRRIIPGWTGTMERGVLARDELTLVGSGWSFRTNCDWGAGVQPPYPSSLAKGSTGTRSVPRHTPSPLPPTSHAVRLPKAVIDCSTLTRRLISGWTGTMERGVLTRDELTPVGSGRSFKTDCDWGTGVQSPYPSSLAKGSAGISVLRGLCPFHHEDAFPPPPPLQKNSLPPIAAVRLKYTQVFST